METIPWVIAALLGFMIAVQLRQISRLKTSREGLAKELLIAKGQVDVGQRVRMHNLNAEQFKLLADLAYCFQTREKDKLTDLLSRADDIVQQAFEEWKRVPRHFDDPGLKLFRLIDEG
jgi:hypothetical protein